MWLSHSGYRFISTMTKKSTSISKIKFTKEKVFFETLIVVKRVKKIRMIEGIVRYAAIEESSMTPWQKLCIIAEVSSVWNSC